MLVFFEASVWLVLSDLVKFAGTVTVYVDWLDEALRDTAITYFTFRHGQSKLFLILFLWVTGLHKVYFQIAALGRLSIPISVNGLLNTIELFDPHSLHGRAHIVLDLILLFLLHLDRLNRTYCHLSDQITAELAKFLHVIRFTIQRNQKSYCTIKALTFEWPYWVTPSSLPAVMLPRSSLIKYKYNFQQI